MKILLVSSFLPYPLFSGGHVRLFNILKHLSKKHEIYLVCEKRDYQTSEDIKEVKAFCREVLVVERKKQWSFENIVKTSFSSYPFLLVGHTSMEMKNKINHLLQKNKFDLIHVETFYVMQNLPKTDVPIVLIEHNVEYLVYKRFAERAFLFVRPILYIDVLKLKYWEEKYWKKVTRLVSVSESDKKIMSRKKKEVKVVPNGVDFNKFKIHPEKVGTKFKVNKKGKTILFIGDFRWFENRDALKWILREIWPKIKLSFWSAGKARAIESHDSQLILWIVGKNIPESIKKMTVDESVIFDENAPTDTSKIYQKSDVLLAPIRVGGGTSFKILEAMASGIPVITTPLGNAINARENFEILVANSTSELAEKIIDILNDKDLYKKIANNARKFIEEKYDWNTIVRKLEDVYESVKLQA